MKVGTVRKIKFWTLRNSYGYGGVIFDNDEQVIYLCRLVRVKSGLKWQIIKNNNQYDDQLIGYDQISLDNDCVEDIEIIKQPMQKYRNNGIRGIEKSLFVSNWMKRN